MATTKNVPSLSKMSEVKKIPQDFLEKCGFRQGKRAIEIHYKDKDGSAAKTQFRNFTSTADRPAKKAFTWETDKEKRIVPYGYHDLVNQKEISILYVGEGATDGATANYLGLSYAGFHGAQNIPNDIFKELIANAKIVKILKEADKAGAQFFTDIISRLKTETYSGLVEVIEFWETGKDLSEVFINNDGNCELTLNFIKEITKSVDLMTTKTEAENKDKSDIFIQLNQGKKCILNEDECYLEIADEGIKLTNFYLKVVGQRVTDSSNGKSREFELEFVRKTAKGIETIPLVVTSDEYNDAKKLFKIVELNVGTKAKIFHNQAVFAVKAMASGISSDSETFRNSIGGFQKNKSYILGECTVTTDGILFGERVIDLSGNKKAEIFNFSDMPRQEAIELFAKAVQLKFKAYDNIAASVMTAFPLLAVLLNIRPDFIQQIRAGLEITGEQGLGKTDYHKILVSYFSSNFSDSDFFRANDTVASLEASIGMLNGAIIAINDIKAQSGQMPLEKYAELIQNIVDAAPYTKIGENKKPVTQTPFVGLPTWNGQQSLTALLSSLASRTIVVSPIHGSSSMAFDNLLKLSTSFCGITPHLIQLCLSAPFQSRLRLSFEHHLLELRQLVKAQFNIERTLKIFAITSACIDMSFEVIKSVTGDNIISSRDLLNLRATAVESIHACCRDQIGRIGDIDIVLKTFMLIVQGLQAGQIFLGENKPEHASSTATCIGEMPNLATDKIWINPGPSLEFVQRHKSANELSNIQQTIFTRELISRGIISKKGERATSRMKQGGPWGWLIDYRKIPVLAEYLTNQIVIADSADKIDKKQMADAPF